MLWASSAVIVVVVAWCLFPDLFGSDDPLAIRPTRLMSSPGWSDLLGTDQYGRSILDLLIHGARATMTVAVLSVLLGATIGTLIGLLAGFLGRFIDGLLMRAVDVLMCFPGILLALLVKAALPTGTVNLVIAVGTASLPTYARVMRSQTIAVRSRGFMTAARALGVRPPAIVTRHLLPHVSATLIVLCSLGLGSSIVISATLSFLGLGRQDPIPDWGLLLAGGQAYFGSAWWIATFPGLAITIVVISANVIGDRLRDRVAARGA